MRDQLIERTAKAYMRSEPARGGIALYPSEPACDVRTLGGKTYVTLRNSYQLLAVYRLMNTGKLKRLDDWPEVLGE